MTDADRIAAIYAAFARGDIPYILAQVADDCVWEYDATTDVPWLLERRGRAGAAEFFQSLAAIEIGHFETRAVLAGPGFVVGVVDIRFTVRATGIPVEERDEMHVWYLNEAGQVSRFRHRADTYLQWRAFHGQG